MITAVRAIEMPVYYQEVMPSIDENLSDMWSDLLDNGISQCPFHDERTPSFRWYDTTNTCYCFGCGNGGDIIAIHRKFTGVSFDEAVEFLFHHFIGEHADLKTTKKLKMLNSESKADLLVFNHTVLDRAAPRNFNLAEELSLLIRLGQITGHEAVAYYQEHSTRARQ